MVPVIFASFCCAYLGIASLINYYRDEKKEYVLVVGKVVRSDKSQFYHKGHHGVGDISVIEYTYKNKDQTLWERVRTMPGNGYAIYR